ncbi:MAG TPA: tetratricopeptide repeat protein [Gemmatimonadaceae bacterium]|nr:tetratricopeptide repeat protein [Gemmatimonadaceae bacterium]
MMSRTSRALTGALCFSLAATAARAQEAVPLHKGDLVRFLTGSTYSKPEIAAIVRRACLAFGPTTRDYQDLRGLGATATVIDAMKRCAQNNNKVARAETAAPAEVRPMEIDLPYRGVTAPAGSVALYTVTVHRGSTPLAGVRLLLRGSREIAGGAHAELIANTDRDGRATFSIPAGTTAGNTNLRIADADGVQMNGVTDFVLTTLPASPSLVNVTPQTLDIGAGRGTRDVTVAVNDPFSNPVPRITVSLKQLPAHSSAIAPSQITDNAGVAHFSIQTAPLEDGDSLVVSIGDRAFATIHVTAAAEITTLLLEAERRLSEGSLTAEGAYDSVLAVDPNNTRALVGRGYVRAAQSKYEPASHDFEEALKSGEDRTSALTGLGYLALRRNDLTNAAARFDEALHIDSTDQGAATGRAYAELWRLDPRQATHRSAALASPRPVSYPAGAANQLRAGIDFFAARNTAAASRALTSAASAAPSWPDVYYERALVYQAQGNTSQAIADFQHYLQLRPNAADRDAVASRIGALDRSPTKAFVSGILPGGGQFYTHQPILGAAVLGGVVASAVWALKSSPIIFTDPFGHPYQAGTERKHLWTGVAVGGGIWLLGAVEAAVHASSARGDPYPPEALAAPARRSAELPHLVPTVGFEPTGPRVGAALSFSIR